VFFGNVVSGHRGTRFHERSSKRSIGAALSPPDARDMPLRGPRRTSARSALRFRNPFAYRALCSCSWTVCRASMRRPIIRDMRKPRGNRARIATERCREGEMAPRGFAFAPKRCRRLRARFQESAYTWSAGVSGVSPGLLHASQRPCTQSVCSRNVATKNATNLSQSGRPNRVFAGLRRRFLPL
jgi:hypothetical protein